MDTKTLNDIVDKHKLWLADLDGGKKADLSWANISSANLSVADLIVIHLPFYTAYIQKTHTRIGCKYFTNEKWLTFTNEEIETMDSNALEFWNQFKKLIKSAIESLNDY